MGEDRQTVKSMALEARDGISINDTDQATIQDMGLGTVGGTITIGPGVNATAARLRSVSGPINAKGARLGSCSAATVTGAIFVPQATGESNATSVTGPIHFNLKDAGGDFAGSIDCGTIFGSVYYNGEPIGKKYTRATQKHG